MASKVFVPDDAIVWAGAVVVNPPDAYGEVEVRRIDESQPAEKGTPMISLSKHGLAELPLQNVDLPPKGIEDMIQLPYLHEANILDNLKRRFFAVQPYTYTGEICVAVNPYRWLDLYSDKIRCVSLSCMLLLPMYVLHCLVA
jgi:myosin-5